MLELVVRLALLLHMGLILGMVVHTFIRTEWGVSLGQATVFGCTQVALWIQNTGFQLMRLPFSVVRVKPQLTTGRGLKEGYTSRDGTRVPSDRSRPHCSGLSEPRGIAFS